MRRLAVSAVLSVFASASAGAQDFSGAEWLRGLLAPPDPVNVGTEVEAGAASSDEITRRGGEIDARGTDGTRYRLSVPRGALSAATRITITPLSRVTGLPEGAGKTLGVRIEPSGLVLAAPATLTIRPAGGIPQGRTPWHFVFDRAGNDFTPVLPGALDGTLAIKISHFSGAGIVLVDPAGKFSQFFEARNPLRHNARSTQPTVRKFYAFWNYFERDGSSIRAGIAELEKSLAATIFRTGINSRGSCDDVRAGYRTVLELMDDFRQLRGPNRNKLDLFYTIPSALDAAAWPGLPPDSLWRTDRSEAAAKFSSCIQEAIRKCSETGDIRDLVKSSFIVRWMREVGGYADNPVFASYYRVFEEGMQRFGSCAAFELAIEGDGTRADERSGYLSSLRWHFRTKMTLRVQLDGSIPVLMGRSTTAMQYDQFQCEYTCGNCAGCSIQGVQASDPVKAELDWEIDGPAGGVYESWCAIAQSQEFAGTPGIDKTPTIDRTPPKDGWEKRCYAVERPNPSLAPMVPKLRISIEPILSSTVYRFTNGQSSRESPPIGPGANWRWSYPRNYRDSHLLIDSLRAEVDGSGWKAQLSGIGKDGITTHTEAMDVELKRLQ